jgi:PAS domain S-box-containing protein
MVGYGLHEAEPSVAGGRFRRIGLWIVGVVGALILTGIVAVWGLYRTQLEMEQQRLLMTAQANAALVEAVLRFDRDDTRDPNDPQTATLRPIQAALAQATGIAKRGALFVVASRGPERLAVVAATPGHDGALPSEADRVYPREAVAETPIGWAAAGRQGIRMGRDHRGQRVIAAVWPIPTLPGGLVVEVQQAAFQAPYRQTAIGVLGIAALVAAAIAGLLYRDGARLITRLQASEQRYRRLFDRTPIGHAELDDGGRFRAVNPALGELLKTPPHDLIGRPWLNCVAVAERSALREAVDASLQHGRGLYERRQTLQCSDDEPIPVTLNVAPVSTPETEDTIAALSIIDRRPQQRAEEQMARSQKLEAVGTLAAGVAHEINNPLMGIHNYLGYVEEELSDPELRPYLRKAERQLERIERIVTQLLTFARSQDPRFAPVELGTLTDDLIAVLRTELAGMTIDRINQAPVWVHTAPEALRQIGVNLLSNASHAVADQAERRLIIRYGIGPEERVFWEVEDNGPGIPPTQQHRIFDPFFTTKPPGRGTGLGLTVSRNLAQALGCQLTYQVGRSLTGACFRLTFPDGAAIDTSTAGPTSIAVQGDESYDHSPPQKPAGDR